MSIRILHCLPVVLIIGASLTGEVRGQEIERGFFPPQQVGAGGGPYLAVVQLSMPEFDRRLTGMGLEGLPEWATLYGAGGHFQIGSLMIGGFSLGGTVDRSGVAGGAMREARVDISHGGLTVGYVKAVSNLKLALGGSIGVGTLAARLSRSPQTGPLWDGIWTYYGTGFTGTVDAGNLDISTELSGSYFFFEPFVSIRYWLIPMVAVDLGAFYRIGGIGSGKLEVNGEKIPDSPKLDLSGMGIKVGVFLGF